MRTGRPAGPGGLQFKGDRLVWRITRTGETGRETDCTKAQRYVWGGSGMNDVKVTVLTGVFNTPKEYLEETVRSVLTQTLGDLELILIDDGSTEVDIKYLEEKDKRIRILTNDENHGSSYSLNRGIEAARGEYIAILDSDDIAFPDRLKRESGYLDNNINTGIVCAPARILGSKEIIGANPGITRSEHRAALFFDNIPLIVHSTVMYRRSFLMEHSLRYDTRYRYSQDYNMWSRCIKYTPVHYLDEPLIYYRRSAGQVSKEKKREQLLCALNVSVEQAENVLKRKLTGRERRVFAGFRKYRKVEDTGCLLGLLEAIMAENRESQLYPEVELERQILMRWLVMAPKNGIHSLPECRLSLKALSIGNLVWTYDYKKKKKI